MENSDVDHNHSEVPDLEAEDVVEDENPFYDAGAANGMARGGLEERLLHALDLNGGGIKVDVADFYGKVHAEDFLDWESSLENYFEWKPMAEN